MALIRKFVFQNPTSGKIYEAVLKRASDGSVSGVGRLLGTNIVNSDPGYDNTEIAFVVLTSKLADVFGTAAKTESHLSQAAIFDAASPVALGAALSTLLV